MRVVRFLLVVAWTLIGVLAAVPQAYQAQPGEVLLQLSVEGRGTIMIRMQTKEAPKTTEHILSLARRGFYDGQRFHEAIRTPRPYLVRLGDPLSKDPSKLDDPKMGTGGSGSKVAFENSGLSHDTGAVGLATVQGERNSGDSQFYIMLAPAKFLDGKYTVFGKVVAGMDVLGRVQKGDVVTSARVIVGQERS
ncbi:MAG: peptidylprolyl isomerase [Armatimonadetes bacterium]|nr:peptidylprolyl isomerase [Armatimonadota bacterium]